MFRKKTEQQTIPEEAVPASYAALMRRAMIRSTVFAALAFATAVLATMAWFASNRSTDSSGMQIQIEASANLVITDDASRVRNLTLNQEPYSVTLRDDSGLKLTAASHRWAKGVATGLYYNTNPSAVNYFNGTEATDKAMRFAGVPVYSNGDERQFYVDHTVYLSSLLSELPVQELNASISLVYDGAEEGHTDPDYIKGFSVDFYRAEANGTSEDTYLGTLNGAGLDFEVNDYTTAKTTIDLMAGEDSKVVPLNTQPSNNYIPVTMRCYFDGNLLKEANTTYVRSHGLDLDDYVLHVAFNAVDAD